MLRLVVPLLGAAIAYTDHTYSDKSLCCGIVVGGVLLSGSFYMYPTVECILCSENVSTAHCMNQRVVK